MKLLATDQLLRAGSQAECQADYKEEYWEKFEG